MKQIYLSIKILVLLICISAINEQLMAQCVLQGIIPNPGCGGSNTTPNVGAAQQWDLACTNNGDYNVSISAGSDCAGFYALSTNSFTGTGSGTQTLNILAGGACDSYAGGTSAVLTYSEVQYTNTTSNANICVGSSRPCTNFPATFGGAPGVFSVINGTGSGSITGTPTTTGGVTFNALTAGTVQIVFTKGDCVSTVNVTIDQTAVITSTPPANEMCESGSFTYTGTPAGGVWSVTGNGGINAGTGDFLPSAIPSPTLSQTSTITYTNGSCSTTSPLTVDATPDVATAGAAQNLCAALTSAPLGGNTPVVGTGVWSQLCSRQARLSAMPAFRGLLLQVVLSAVMFTTGLFQTVFVRRVWRA